MKTMFQTLESIDNDLTTFCDLVHDLKLELKEIIQ